MKININTKDGINKITTSKLKGELKAVIITKSGKRLSKTRIIIDSEIGYNLLDCTDFIENIYIPLCSRRINKNMHLVNEWISYYVDEKLKITVVGAKNQEIQIILRMG